MTWNLKQRLRDQEEAELEEEEAMEELIREMRHSRHHRHDSKGDTWKLLFWIIFPVVVVMIGILGPQLEKLPTITWSVPTPVALQPTEQQPSEVEQAPAQIQDTQGWSYVPLVLGGSVQTFFMWQADNFLNAPNLAELPLSLQLDCPTDGPSKGIIIQDITVTAQTVFLITEGRTENVTVEIVRGESPVIAQIAFVCQPDKVFFLRW